MKTYAYTVFDKAFSEALSNEKNLHISKVSEVPGGAYRLEIKNGKLKESLSYLTNFGEEYVFHFGRVVRGLEGYVISKHFRTTRSSFRDVSVGRY